MDEHPIYLLSKITVEHPLMQTSQQGPPCLYKHTLSAVVTEAPLISPKCGHLAIPCTVQPLLSEQDGTGSQEDGKRLNKQGFRYNELRLLLLILYP